MNINKINQDLATFKQRIIETLQLKHDESGFINSTRKFSAWIADEEARY